MTPGGAGVTPQSRHGVATMILPKGFKVNPYHLYKAPASAVKGIATAQFAATGTSPWYVYPKNNAANGPEVCSNAGSGINGVGADSQGDLIVPNGLSGISVYAPPFTASSCGTLLGTIPVTGQVEDAAAINAATGPFLTATNSGVAYLCQLPSTCTALPSAGQGGSFTQVAMDKNGNCYTEGYNANFSGQILVVYSGTSAAPCTGSGFVASGFTQASIGGIDVDNAGNIVAISLGVPSSVSTWKGCATGTCTPIQASTALTGESVYGHVGKQQQRWVTGDVTNNDVEVYSYSPATGVGKMLYNFNNGMTGCGSFTPCEAAAYMPNSQK
jgi:hypothetical protein